MFVPQVVNLMVYKGSTFEAEFHLLDSSGLPFDITDWTARMQIRESYESTSTAFNLTTENGGISIVKELNTDNTIKACGYKVSISASDTAAVTITDGVYDIELIDTNGRVGRIQQGSVTFDPEVTR